MKNSDLEIRLVRLEKHVVFVTNIVCIILAALISAAVFYVTASHWAILAAPVAGLSVLGTYWFCRREILEIEKPFIEMTDSQRAEQEAAFERWAQEQ